MYHHWEGISIYRRLSYSLRYLTVFSSFLFFSRFFCIHLWIWWEQRREKKEKLIIMEKQSQYNFLILMNFSVSRLTIYNMKYNNGYLFNCLFVCPKEKKHSKNWTNYSIFYTSWRWDLVYMILFLCDIRTGLIKHGVDPLKNI